MLKRVRIEVEAESPDAALDELWKYEHAIQTVEAERYGLGYSDRDFVVSFANWAAEVSGRSFYNDALGRQVREEVIEFDPGIPGWKGRRVVAYTRLDTRTFIYSHDPGNQVPGQAPAITGGIGLYEAEGDGIEREAIDLPADGTLSPVLTAEDRRVWTVGAPSETEGYHRVEGPGGHVLAPTSIAVAVAETMSHSTVKIAGPPSA